MKKEWKLIFRGVPKYIRVQLVRWSKNPPGRFHLN